MVLGHPYGVSAVALGDRLFTDGTIMAVDIQDAGLEECGDIAMPALPVWGVGLLAMALGGVALLKQRGGTRVLRCALSTGQRADGLRTGMCAAPGQPRETGTSL